MRDHFWISVNIFSSQSHLAPISDHPPNPQRSGQWTILWCPAGLLWSIHEKWACFRLGLFSHVTYRTYPTNQQQYRVSKIIHGYEVPARHPKEQRSNVSKSKSRWIFPCIVENLRWRRQTPQRGWKFDWLVMAMVGTYCWWQPEIR